MSEIEALDELLDKEEYIYVLAYEDNTKDGFKTIKREELDRTRWGVVMRIITEGPSGKLYAWTYEEGATEMQDYMEYYPGDIKEVKAITRQITVTTYQEV